jgi:hypothetical protein
MKNLVAKTMIKNVRELVKYFGLKYKLTSFQVLSLLVNQHQVSTLKKLVTSSLTPRLKKLLHFPLKSSSDE